MLYKTISLFALAFLLSNCSTTSSNDALAQPQRIARFQIGFVRLHDGVPLDINFDLRWQIADPENFGRFQMSPDSFRQVMMLSRAEEALRTMAHQYTSVDSVFFSQRAHFLRNAKETLLATLQKDGVQINDIVITALNFPESYVEAMESAGLQRQELERIKQQTSVAIAQAEGERRKTEANSRVQLAQEEANARIRDMQASGEQRRRNAEIARAETEVQLEAKRAQIAADRQRQMDLVELEKVAQQNKLNLERTREMDNVELAKVARQNELNYSKNLQLNDTELQRNRDLAKVYQDNPGYASFVVNKELAAKVNIAVLPSGQEQGVLSHFLEQNISGKKN